MESVMVYSWICESPTHPYSLEAILTLYIGKWTLAIEFSRQCHSVRLALHVITTLHFWRYIRACEPVKWAADDAL